MPHCAEIATSMEDQHTMTAFDGELNRLKNAVRLMGTLAGSQLDSAMEALLARDVGKARRTVQRDAEVNGLEQKVDSLTLRLLALRQPVATDLRHIITAGKMAGELERIADYAANIAKRVGEPLSGPEAAGTMGAVRRMGQVAGAMLEEAMGAYAARDAVAAAEVWQRDDEIDAIYAGVLEALRAHMSRHPGCVQPCLDLLYIARCVERVGDHVTNLAEQVYFLVTGRMFRGEEDH